MDDDERKRLDQKCRQDIEQFLTEIQGETDRGMALVSLAVIDTLLEEILTAHMCDDLSPDHLKKMFKDNGGALSTLSSKQDVAYAFGLIEKGEYREITTLRRIRNEFAHATYGLSFASATIRPLCIKLTDNIPDNTPTERLRFMISVNNIYHRLYFRTLAVSYKRNQRKQWVNPESVRWRSVDEDPGDLKPSVVIGRTGISPAIFVDGQFLAKRLPGQ